MCGILHSFFEGRFLLDDLYEWEHIYGQKSEELNSWHFIHSLYKDCFDWFCQVPSKNVFLHFKVPCSSYMACGGRTTYVCYVMCICLAENRKHTSALSSSVTVNLVWSLWLAMQVWLTRRWSRAVGDCYSCMTCHCSPPIWLRVGWK